MKPKPLPRRTGAWLAVGAAAFAAPTLAWALDVAQVVAPRPVVMRAGETRQVAIEVIVKPGYHVQANPAAWPYLIPTALTMAPAPGVTVGVPRYPPPKRLRLASSGEELLVYERRFEIVVPITQARRDAAPVQLQGSLSYQGCDDRRCFFPRTAPVELTVVGRAEAAR
ncbi:MAG: hypothetical protein HZC37_02815 [Burkholderiales bacterium]|nr:hypothetical protein [Burkholderiales bacterium]